MHSHHPWRQGNDPFLLHDVICSECITMHCQWGGKPLQLPLPLRHPAGVGPSHGHRQHVQNKLVKIACVVPAVSCWSDRQTHRQTDRCLSQYVTNASTGEVNMHTNKTKCQTFMLLSGKMLTNTNITIFIVSMNAIMHIPVTGTKCNTQTNENAYFLTQQLNKFSSE